MRYSTISHLALIKISGVDATRFLQGQLTNDVELLDSQWQLSGYCNPKGRLLALFRLWRTEENYYALVAKELVESICRRLRMYVLRSKVEIDTISAANIIIALDKQALSKLSPDLSILPELSEPSELSELSGRATQRKVINVNGNFLLNDPATQNYLYIEPEPSSEIGYSPSAEQAWHLGNMQAGIPQINAATSELFVPQMINLDLLDGINFKKGCYTGQEIVARMHYLGKLKQRLFLCNIGGQLNKPAQAAEKVFSDHAFSKSSGTLLSVDHHANIALAVMRLSELASEHHLENGQQLLVLEQQPYPIPLAC